MTDTVPDLPKLHRLHLTAMNTTFELCIPGGTKPRARKLAAAAFEEVTRLELMLSRFIATSDIARVNAAAGVSMMRVSTQTMECLRVARNVAAETGGAFDVTVGPLLACWRPEGGPPREPEPAALAEALALTGLNLLEMDEEDQSVGLRVAGARLDLGAIGKGYAVDQMVRILRARGVKAALVSGGGSTIYALGAPEGHEGWPVGVGHGADTTDPNERRLILRDLALSISGPEFQGEHILDPRTGFPPRGACQGAWSLNPSATVADALSTAFLVQREDEIEAICRKFGDVGAILLVESEGRKVLRRFGAIPE